MRKTLCSEFYVFAKQFCEMKLRFKKNHFRKNKWFIEVDNIFNKMLLSVCGRKICEPFQSEHLYNMQS